MIGTGFFDECSIAHYSLLSNKCKTKNKKYIFQKKVKMLG